MIHYRWAILQADSVLENFRELHGDYPKMFEDMINEGIASYKPKLRASLQTFDVRFELPEFLDCDGYLVTGSRHSVYEDLDWIVALAEFLKRAFEAQKKIVGICFGHQLLAHFFGGRVGPCPSGWAVGVRETQLVQIPSWLKSEQPRQTFNLLSSHKDQVEELPGGASIFARNDFCPISGFTMGVNVMTLQGHPEFSKDYARALMDYRRDILGVDSHARGVSSLEQPIHRSEVISWILNFLTEDHPENNVE